MNTTKKVKNTNTKEKLKDKKNMPKKQVLSCNEKNKIIVKKVKNDVNYIKNDNKNDKNEQNHLKNCEIESEKNGILQNENVVQTIQNQQQTISKSDIVINQIDNKKNDKEKQKNKKDIAKSIFSYCILAFCIVMLFYVSICKITNSTPRIFGYSFHYVVTDSMTPEINIGDFVVAKNVDKSIIKVGDYIVFKTDDPSLKASGITEIIHKVIGISVDESGEIEFTTQGIKSGASQDAYKAKNLIGLYVGKSAFFGAIFSFFSNPISWVIVISGILLVSVSIGFFKKALKEYKKEETNEIKEEVRQEIESEKNKK